MPHHHKRDGDRTIPAISAKTSRKKPRPISPTGGGQGGMMTGMGTGGDR